MENDQFRQHMLEVRTRAYHRFDDREIYHKFVCNEDVDPWDETIFDWLEQQDPDECFLVASTWNWDEWLGPLFWIVEQSDCDRATAKVVLGLNGAFGWLGLYPSFDEFYRNEQHAEVYKENWDLHETIVTRWRSGLYNRSEIKVSNTSTAEQVAAQRAAHPHLPPDIFDSQDGKDLCSDRHLEGIGPKYEMWLVERGLAVFEAFVPDDGGYFLSRATEHDISKK